MLPKLIVAVISQHIQISNHYVGHLKLIQCYMSIITQLEQKEKKEKVPGQRTLLPISVPQVCSLQPGVGPPRCWQAGEARQLQGENWGRKGWGCQPHTWPLHHHGLSSPPAPFLLPPQNITEKQAELGALDTLELPHASLTITPRGLSLSPFSR